MKLREKLRELISCAACLRGSRDWRTVTLTVDGVVESSHQLCRACATDFCDLLERELRERQLAAVRR